MKVIKHKDKWYLQSDTGYKEILLSTDTELQKDGVQAIDDEFLEWFVKNPSCDRVEISLEETQYGSGIYEYVIYKKEIPKEESKKIFNLPIATNLGNAFTETMKSVSQHEGGIRQGEINLPSFKEEVCICTDECLGYLTKTCKRIEEPEQRLEKYSERFDNKENEVVDGIFDSENWGRRVVKQETLTNDTNSHSWGFENFEVIKTEEDAKIFAETMENTPEPNDKLKKAFEDFKEQETLEYGLLQHIKFCLECKNDSQAIRLIEKYGFEKQERMYSEWEVRQIIKIYSPADNKLSIREILEQFKK